MIQHTFNTQLAIDTGVQEAILYNWLQCHTLSSGDTTTNTSKISSELKTAVFPFWSDKEFLRFISALVTKNLIELLESTEQSITVKIVAIEHQTQKQRKKRGVAQESQNDSDMITYLKTTEEGLSEVTTTSKGKLVNEMIDKFKHINVLFVQFYKRQSERKALENLIDNVNVDTIFKLLDVIPKTNTMPYAPIIMRPVDLERNYSKLIAFIQRENAAKNKTKITL